MTGVEGRLQRAIDAQALSRAEFASRVGVDVSTVSRWMTRGAITTSKVPDVCEVLEATPEWLMGEQQPLPQAILRYERTRYEDSGLQWVFPKSSAASETHGNANIFTVPTTLEQLVAESSTNSSDKPEDESPIQMVYSLIRLSGGARSEFLERMRYRDLSRHLDAVSNDIQQFGRKVKDGLDYLGGIDDATKDIYLMRVEDYGTEGLWGYEIRPLDKNVPTADLGNFIPLVRANMLTNKSGREGGSYGLGKAVHWATSAIGTVLIRSRIAPSLVREDERSDLVIGRSDIGFHFILDDAAAYEDTGHLGVPLDDHQAGMPVWNNEALAQDLYLDRSNGKPGTSLLTVGFRDPDLEYDDPEKTLAGLRRGVIRKWWPAIYERRMDFQLRFYEGREQKVAEDVDPGSPAWDAPLLGDAYEKWVTEADTDVLGEPGDVRVVDLDLLVPPRKDGSHGEIRSTAKLVVRLVGDDEDPDPTENEVAMFRGFNRMVVKYLPVRPDQVNGHRFVAFVACGTAVDESEGQLAAEAFLRLAEPSGHDDWRSTSAIRATYKQGYGVALKDFQDAVRRAMKEMFSRSLDQDEDGPDSLRELLQFSGSGERDDVPNLVGVSIEPLNGNLRIRSEFRLSNRSEGWSFRLVPKVVGESVKNYPLRWKDLKQDADTAGCRVEREDDFRVVVEQVARRKERTVVLVGETDELSHSISPEMTAITVAPVQIAPLRGETQ